MAALAASALPRLTDWPQGVTLIVALGILAGGAVAHALLLRGRDRSDIDGLKRSLATLAKEWDRLGGEVREIKSEIADSSSRSQEMIHEMRMLQSLLNQVVARSGGGGRPAPAPPAEGAAKKRPAATKAAQEAAQEAAEEADLLQVVRNALSANRVDLYLQPTVALPSRRTVHYECYSRVRDTQGNIIYPREFLPVAEDTGLVGTIDNLLLFRCIQIVRKLGPRRPGVRFFCNVSSASLHDEDFFPQFVEYMTTNLEFADRLVFELSQEELQTLQPAIARRLEQLGGSGYRFCVDQVEELHLDAAALAGRHVRYAKIDVDRLLAGAPDLRPPELRERLKRSGIALVAAKVEEESQVVELLDLHVEFAQGYLFGQPRQARDEPVDVAEEQEVR